MMFNFPEGRKPEPHRDVEVGNVYASKNTHKTVAWVVMSITGNTVHMLGINADGAITTTQSYNMHALENRTVIGVVDLSKLEFDIEPV